MVNWYLTVLRKFADFSGRARRSEYWYFVLANMIIGFILGLVDGVLGLEVVPELGMLSIIYNLFILIPSIAVGVRRLHDTGRSGWWWLIVFIPLVGAIVLLVFFVTEGEQGENQYGPNPKEMTADDLSDHLVE